MTKFITKTDSLTVLLSCIFLLSTACGERRTIRIDGSSTVYRITEAVVEEFLRENRDVHPDVGISGTGGGFQKFCDGSADITNASRAITVAEMEKCAAAGIEFIELPVAYDGLAIVVHADNEFVKEFTIENLRKIFSAQNPASSWKEVNEEYPDLPVKVASPGQDSGTFDYFAGVVLNESGQLRPDALVSEDDNTIVRAVSGDKYSVGFFGFAYYDESKEKLKLVPVVNPATGKAVEPSKETVKSGSYSPLSRPLFVYVNKESLKNPDVVRFMDFYLKHAGALSEDAGYISLRSEAYQKIQNHFGNQVTGSRFAGKEMQGKTVESLY